MSRNAGGFLGGVLALFVFSALSVADAKGHFTRKVLFDANEAKQTEAAHNILAYQEQGSDLNPQCYLFWIGNYLHVFLTLIDFLSDVMYIATVPNYNLWFTILLPLTLAAPYITIGVLAWIYAVQQRETRKERVKYAFKAFGAACTGSLHVFLMID